MANGRLFSISRFLTRFSFGLTFHWLLILVCFFPGSNLPIHLQYRIFMNIKFSRSSQMIYANFVQELQFLSPLLFSVVGWKGKFCVCSNHNHKTKKFFCLSSFLCHDIKEWEEKKNLEITFEKQDEMELKREEDKSGDSAIFSFSLLLTQGSLARVRAIRRDRNGLFVPG